jgi:hypothetical protein
MSQNNSENELKTIMNDIEAKTESIIITAIKRGKIINPTKIIIENNSFDKNKLVESTNFLTNIMKSGNDEFEKKIGRSMTYSEMRAMYG